MTDKLTGRLVGGTGGTVTQAKTVDLLADAWFGGEGVYSQIVEADGTSIHSKVDLQPSADQLQAFHSMELALATENNNGVITVYAFGCKPETDIAIQATVTEVIRESQNMKIMGNTVGATAPLLYPKSLR